jgi:hypothetical protein
MDRRDALKALMALPATARISRVTIQPHDVIVIEVDNALTGPAARNIQTSIERIWPDHKAIVLDPGMRLRIVSEMPRSEE